MQKLSPPKIAADVRDEREADPRMQNKKGMQGILEQAAKEWGDAFTNRQKHEHTGNDGKDLVPRKITVNEVKSKKFIKIE